MTLLADQEYAETKELYDQEVHEMNAERVMAMREKGSKSTAWYDVKALVNSEAYDHHKEALEVMTRSLTNAKNVQSLQRKRASLVMDTFINDIRQDAWERAQERVAAEAKEAEEAAEREAVSGGPSTMEPLPKAAAPGGRPSQAEIDRLASSTSAVSMASDGTGSHVLAHGYLASLTHTEASEHANDGAEKSDTE